MIGVGAEYLFGASNVHTVTTISTTTAPTVTATSVVTSPTVTTTVTTTEVSSNLPSSPLALMTTSSHLLLRLNLSNSTISEGKNITLGFSLTNTLPAPNDRPLATAWAIAGLYWPGDHCSTTGYYEPLGIAIFKGYFSAGNVSSGTVLSLWHPGTVFGCPPTPGVSSWNFQPSSDIAGNLPLHADFSTNGYWTGGDRFGNGAVFVHFGPGTYTVAAGDEWGDLLLLTFTVI